MPFRFDILGGDNFPFGISPFFHSFFALGDHLTTLDYFNIFLQHSPDHHVPVEPLNETEITIVAHIQQLFADFVDCRSLFRDLSLA